MAEKREIVTPASKPVPGARSGVQDGGHKILTTPKDADGNYWNYDKDITQSIMGKV